MYQVTHDRTLTVSADRGVTGLASDANGDALSAV